MSKEKIILKSSRGEFVLLTFEQNNVKIDKRKDLSRIIRCLELPHWNTPYMAYWEEALFAANTLLLVLRHNGGHQNERLLQDGSDGGLAPSCGPH